MNQLVDFLSQITEIEPCHKFAWCLDACEKDNTVETRRIKELQSFFDHIQSGDRGATMFKLKGNINSKYSHWRHCNDGL